MPFSGRGRLIAIFTFSRRTDCLTGRNLTPKEKARLTERIGLTAYLAPPYGEPNQLRGADGRYRPR